MASRFECLSASLAQRSLLGRRGLGVGLLVALSLHAASTQLRGGGPEQRAAKPLTTQFVKRQPRLTKPLEMKKRPRPKQRRVERRMVAVKARASSQGMGLRESPGRVVQALARPNAHVGRAVALEHRSLDAVAISEAVEGTREPRRSVDMGLEMLDVEALDTGQYHAMVIQDPRDKGRIRGYFHLNIVHSHAYIAMSQAYHSQMLDCVNVTTSRLVEALNMYTDIKADIGKHVYLDSNEVFAVPWYFLSSERPFKLGRVESDYLGRYLLRGGFFILDYVDHFASFPKGALSSILEEAMASQGMVPGRDWSLEFLPKDHPLFHCFFDFDGEPFGRVPPTRYTGWETDRYLKGLVLDDGLVALYSSRGYGNVWGDWGRVLGSGYAAYADLDPTRHIQFGVNTIIFALTREGSITNQITDNVQ